MARKNVTCTITVTEIDGKLTVIASVPDDAQESIAAALTNALIEASARILNEVLDANETVREMRTN